MKNTWAIKCFHTLPNGFNVTAESEFGCLPQIVIHNIVVKTNSHFARNNFLLLFISKYNIYVTYKYTHLHT